ncbi:phosphatase PAP2 family protein [Paludibacterium yongneupense]|uniref:phosphatase PAP2 family protein n=1 Tax=Paludibacterium yongneupense TaxID=400061 RepID=UPI0009FE3212|nr:phosphatase PAP2 family protein [Paludibacterium yongneupense]
MWAYFTNLGDLSVMVPAACLIVVWLLCNREWSRAGRWIALFGLGGLLVASSKILFIGWGYGSQRLDFTGISGHTMLASSVLPVVFFLGLSALAPRTRYCGLALGLLCGALIGYSRLMVHVHSLSEVVAGFCVGAVVSLLFAWRIPLRRNSRFGAVVMAVAFGLVLNWQFGVRAPGQDIMTRIALHLAGHDVPYVRGVWRG